MITNKKTFTLGLLLLISFIVVFAYMMSPNFGNGRNGLEYADDMFNSLSKGSAYFIQNEMKKVDKLAGTSFDVKLNAADSTEAETWNKLYTTAGAGVSVAGTEVTIKGDLGSILKAILVDCDAMYNNKGNQVSSTYGIEERTATLAWYNSLKAMSSFFDKQGSFTESAAVQSVMKKALEPAYNYYGIEAKQVADNKGVVFFLLAFYLVYTIWYGFAIYYIFDGLGVTMTKSAKKVEA